MTPNRQSTSTHFLMKLNTRIQLGGVLVAVQLLQVGHEVLVDLSHAAVANRFGLAGGKPVRLDYRGCVGKRFVVWREKRKASYQTIDVESTTHLPSLSGKISLQPRELHELPGPSHRPPRCDGALPCANSTVPGNVQSVRPGPFS